MSNEETKKEEGLTEEELADVTGGAKTAGAMKESKTFTTVEKLPGGASAIHIKSEFGAISQRTIREAGA